MIDAELARFLGEGLGIHIGTRDKQLQPNGARVTAIKVEGDGTHVIAYVPQVAAPRVLRDLSNGPAAVVFARPIDDRACQLKGVFAGARPATAEEEPDVRAQWARFLISLEQIGIPPQALAGWSIWPSVAVRIRVTALFNQTPGPNAGAPLEGR
jgi:hypothetical protein